MTVHFLTLQVNFTVPQGIGTEVIHDAIWAVVPTPIGLFPVQIRPRTTTVVFAPNSAKMNRTIALVFDQQPSLVRVALQGYTLRTGTPNAGQLSDFTHMSVELSAPENSPGQAPDANPFLVDVHMLLEFGGSAGVGAVPFIGSINLLAIVQMPDGALWG